jgi:hypothetical protein
MDPYLEDPAHWPDFHSRFVNYWCEAVTAALPSHYTARIGERVYLIDGTNRRLITPDIALERQPGPRSRARPGHGGTATATLCEPVTLPLPALAEPRETYIEILHREDRSLVTVLELLSPANKESPGRGLYLAKRNALIVRDVSIVELDLLLGGQRPPLRDEVELPVGDYYAFVSPADRRPDCDVYAWDMPRPLPNNLPIPLRKPDAPVAFDLAAVFALVYERGGYAREVDYAGPPPVSVDDDLLRWIGEVTQVRRDGAGT